MALIPIITPTPKYRNQAPIKLARTLVTTTFRLSQDQKPETRKRNTNYEGIK